MKVPHVLRRVLIPFVLVVTGLIAWAPPAQAGFNDFFKVYKQIESEAKKTGVSLPVSSTAIETYKDLFQCVEGGGNALECTNKFHETDAGKKVTGDIPEAVWQVVDAYLAWKAGDVWGVVKHLGEAALCAVLQVLTGGFDACGLIKELIAVGEAFLDAGKAVAEFLKDLGEGAAGLVKGVYCASPLSVFGGCDDPGPPPKPAAQVIYEKFFAPKVLPDGLIAIETEGLAFHNLEKQLQDQAMAKGYSKTDSLLASIIFDKAVDKQWTSHIVNNVLKDLAAERSQFNTAGRISVAADHAWSKYKKEWDKYLKGSGWPGWQSYPDKTVPHYCSERFSTLGFGHVDRWIKSHDEAATLNVMGNYQWCEKIFWEGNKSKFAPYFRKHMETMCPGLGCSSKGDLALCEKFLVYVGLNCVLSAKVGGPAAPAVAKPSEGVLAALARPNLSVTSVQVKIEPNCQASQPAMTATVTIKNIGGALPANKGTVAVKEQGGTGLGSAGIQIPAIGTGQTQVVSVPAMTRQPYSSLAGSHQVQVVLKAQSKGGQLSFSTPADPYVFSAVFPSGHCRATRQQQQKVGGAGRQ